MAAKKVDRFYGDLLEAKTTDRKYSAYSERYVEIESDLRSLYVRNNARPLNRESTGIADIILQKWIKYKDKHKSKDTYSNGMATADRDRFTRLFTSALSAEAKKNLTADDQDKDSDDSKE
jgi:hypothetical protein